MARDQFFFDGPAGDLKFRWTTHLSSSTGISTRGSLECQDTFYPLNARTRAIATSTFRVLGGPALSVLTDSACSGTAPPQQTATGVLTVTAGSSRTLDFSLELGSTMYVIVGQAEFAQAFADASNTATFWLDPITPGSSYTASSGNTYFTPTATAPEPAAFVLFAPALFMLYRRSRLCRPSPRSLSSRC